MEILRKNPGFAVLALLILSLCFGVLGALVIAAKGVLLDDLPFKDPSRLVVLQGTFEENGEVQEWGISHIDFLDWRKQIKGFEQMAAFSPGEMVFNLVAGKQTERLSGELVSYNYFSILGGEPVLGRAFTAEEDGEPFKHPVTVLSHDLWQRRFGGDRGVLGRSLDLNGQPYKVIGVAPQGFHGLSGKADAWIPSSMPPAPIYVANRRMRWLGVVAPLKPGVTLNAAQEDMNRITAALAKQHPESNKGMGVRVSPLKDLWFVRLGRGIGLLTLGAFVLLLLGCFNVAVLLRTRVRAEAASGPPAARQVLTRSVLLSLVGAAVGLALAAWAARVLPPVSGLAFPGFARLSAGPEVIVAGLSLAVACGLGIGFAALRDVRGRRLAIVAQSALALALLVCAGLMAKGYRQAVDRGHLGFRPENLLVVRVDLQGPKYSTDEQVIEVVRHYLTRTSNLPGVKSLAIGGPTIPTDAWVGGYITIEDHDSGTPAGTYPIMTHSVTPGYFETLGVPIVQGRGFTMADSGKPGTPFNVIVSKAMAEQQWPGQNPIGKRLKFSTRSNPAHPWLPVVGVAGDVQHEGLMADKRPAPDIYLPILISPIRLPTTLNFLVVPESGVQVASLIPVLRREIQAVTPDTPLYDPATLEERLGKQTREARFLIGLVFLFAGLALLLATAGVYGAVVSAASGVRGSLVLAGIGVVLGLLGVWALSDRLVGLLHGAGINDPLILAGMAALVLLLAFFASALGARRPAARDEISRPDRPVLGGRAAL